MTTETLFELSPGPESWHTRRLIGFDLETTGPDPRTALIVSAALVAYEPAGPGREAPPRVREWLVDPGVEIPAGSTAVHGITTEHVRMHGVSPEEALPQLLDALRTEFASDAVVVAMNAPYDLTVLAAEAARQGLDFPHPEPVVDPLVIDKQVDRYRRGKRTLGHLCTHYGVVLDGAHSAAPDAEAAVEVALRLALRYPQLQVPAGEIHALQTRWKAEQAADLQEYFRRTRPDAVVDPVWPM